LMTGSFVGVPSVEVAGACDSRPQSQRAVSGRVLGYPASPAGGEVDNESLRLASSSS
jgi:hypothetical protein